MPNTNIFTATAAVTLFAKRQFLLAQVHAVLTLEKQAKKNRLNKGRESNPQLLLVVPILTHCHAFFSGL